MGKDSGLVEINGESFFTARWVMEQTGYLMASIERAKTIAKWSLALTGLSVLLALAAFLT